MLALQEVVQLAIFLQSVELLLQVRILELALLQVDRVLALGDTLFVKSLDRCFLLTLLHLLFLFLAEKTFLSKHFFQRSDHVVISHFLSLTQALLERGKSLVLVLTDEPITFGKEALV